MPSGPPRAALYVRLSRNRDDEPSASTVRQEAACRALAERQGYEVTTVLVDDDVSAYSGKVRPGYTALLDAIQTGAVDKVVSWAPDRLHRSPRELEDFLDAIDAAGVGVETVQAGRWDLSTPSGRMNARMLGNVARYESEHRSARTSAAHEQIAAEGRWSGGRRPYGYRPEPDGSMVIEPEEAEVVREAVRRVIAGERVGAVANDLNRRGIPTMSGASWRNATLRRIVLSPTIAGLRVHRGEVVGPGRWPAIISPEDHEAAVAALSGGVTRGPIPRVALLSGGRLVCETCSAPMSTARRQSGGRTYRCKICFRQIVAERLDELVEAAVVDVLDRSLVPDHAPRPRSADDLASLERDLADLAADHGAGVISRAEWTAARTPLLARVEAAREAAAESYGTRVLVGLVGRGRASSAWPSMTLDKRQAVVDALIESVVVSPALRRGPGLDPDRVDIKWRA